MRVRSGSANKSKDKALWLFSPNDSIPEFLDWFEKEKVIGLSLWQKIDTVYMDPVSKDIVGCQTEGNLIDTYLVETWTTFAEKMKDRDYVLVLIPKRYEFQFDKDRKRTAVIREDEYLLFGVITSGVRALDYDKNRLKRSESYHEKFMTRRYQRSVSWKAKIYTKKLRRSSPLRDVVDVLGSMRNPGILRMNSYLDDLLQVVK